MVKRVLAGSLMVLAVLAFASPVEARFADPIPGVDPSCDSCICNRSRCFNEAYRIYDICIRRAFTVGEHFSCETAHDFDRAGCGIEYTACLINPFT